LARRVGRDDRLASPLSQPVTGLASVIGAVRQQAARHRTALKDKSRSDQIMGVAGCEGEAEGPAMLVGQGMNLGSPSAARTSDGMLERPPFAPAAERCALM